MSLYRVFHSVKSKIWSMAYSAFYSSPLKMCLDSTFASFKSVHLTRRIISSRRLVGTPMIQNLRYMHHFPGFFHTSENKIIVLCSVKFPAESAHFFYKLPPHNKKVTNIVIGTKQINIKIRLQVWLKMLVQFSSHLILICVYCIPMLMLVQCIHNLVKSIWRKKIIMIQKPHKFSLCHGKCSIGVLCNSFILSKLLPAYSPVPAAVFFQHFSHRLIFRTSIGNAKLPVLIGLCFQ